MRVLVLGGTSFLGPPTVRWLIDAGHEVAVFHRGTTEPLLPPSPAVAGNRCAIAEDERPTVAARFVGRGREQTVGFPICHPEDYATAGSDAALTQRHAK